MKLTQPLPLALLFAGRLSIVLLVMLNLAACGSRKSEESIHETRPVVRRDIIVAVEASGIIEPSVTVELKSQASGQSLEMKGETGGLVEAGTLLVRDRQAQPAQHAGAGDGHPGSGESPPLHRRGAGPALREPALREDHQRGGLRAVATRTRQCQGGGRALGGRGRGAPASLEDTDLRAPITGTIIEKLVETAG